MSTQPKKKTTKPTTTREKRASLRAQNNEKAVWLGEYKDLITFKVQTITPAFIERYIDKMLHQARTNDDFITIEDLHYHFGVPNRTFYQWIQQYDFFAEAVEDATRMIGRRREGKGLDRKFDVGMVRSSMHHYSQRWKQGDEWRASLKDQDKNADRNITIVIEDFPDKAESLRRRSTPEEVGAKAAKNTRYPKRKLASN